MRLSTWLRKNGVAGMDVRNVPVLGVEDLEGAAGLDQVF